MKTEREREGERLFEVAFQRCLGSFCNCSYSMNLLHVLGENVSPNNHVLLITIIILGAGDDVGLKS